MKLSFNLPLDADKILDLLENDPQKILELLDVFETQASGFRDDVLDGGPISWPDDNFFSITRALTVWARHAGLADAGALEALGRAVMAAKHEGKIPWGDPPTEWKSLLTRAHALRDALFDDARGRGHRQAEADTPDTGADSQADSGDTGDTGQGVPHHHKDPDDRLRGWKEIALFCKVKATRTAQNWEKKGMPVHREGGVIWASKAELSAWFTRKK